MLQHGSYTLLIDACYDREQFPTIDEAIEWTWASTPEEIDAVHFVLNRFFKLNEDHQYVQERILEELNEYHAKANKNQQIAIDRETKRKENNTNRARNVNEPPPNQEPLTNNHKPKQEQAEVTDIPYDPKPSASVCLILKQQNILDVNPSHPTLLALLEAGASIEEFGNAAATAKIKKFNYILGIVKSQREQAAKDNLVKGNFKTEDNTWRVNETKMVAKAKELGIGTSGLSKFDLAAKIADRIEQRRGVAA